MRKLLCIIVALSLSFASAAVAEAGDCEAALRDRLSRTAGTAAIAQFDCADYDGDGISEAFALISEPGETGPEDGVEGEIWFVSPTGCVKLHDADTYLTVGRIGISPSLYSAETWYGGSASSAIAWAVSGGEAVLLGADFEGLAGSETPNEFYMYPSAFDLTADGTGHTWKRYYFFLDGLKLKEYGGMLLSRDRLEEVTGARELLAGAEAEGWTVGDIYYRGNNIINVNLHDEWSNNNLTLRYDNGAVTDTGERYGGSYAAASGLTEAIYPDAFPPAGGSLFFLPDLTDNRPEFTWSLASMPEPTPEPTPVPTPVPTPKPTPKPTVAPNAGKITRMAGDSVLVDSDVNLRKSPSLDGEIITSVKVGTTLEFLGEACADERGIDWYKVKWKGHKGWTSSKYTRVVSGGSGKSGKSGGSKKKSKSATTIGDVNLRKSPSLDGDVIISIPANTRVEYLGKVSTDERGVDWYKVKWKGHKGWASSKYTRLD